MDLITDQTTARNINGFCQ